VGWLPTEHELSEKFKTTHQNAHRAVKKLEDRGLVVRNKKGGTVLEGVLN